MKTIGAMILALSMSLVSYLIVDLKNSFDISFPTFDKILINDNK